MIRVNVINFLTSPKPVWPFRVNQQECVRPQSLKELNVENLAFWGDFFKTNWIKDNWKMAIFSWGMSLNDNKLSY